MTKTIGEYILHHRLQTIGIALLLAYLPLFNALALIILALVTLRKGEQEGLWILLAMLLPPLVNYALARIDGLLLAITAADNILLWFLAGQLRRTNSWTWVLQVGITLAIAVVVLAHVVNPAIDLGWEQRLSAYLHQAKTIFIFSSFQWEQLTPFIRNAAKMATGVQAAVALSTSLIWLMVGRWWQATLFNPGKLSPELHNINIAQSLAIALAVLLVTAFLTRAKLFLDLVPLGVLPFTVAGLSLIHYFVAAKKITIVWLGLLYLIMATLFFYVTTGLMALGLLNSFIDFRKKIAVKP